MVGATKTKELKTLELEYEKRLQSTAQCENKIVEQSRADERMRCQTEEKERLFDKIDDKSCLVALDERGEEFTSEEFAKWLEKERDFGSGKVQFIIGGSHGLHPDLLSRANKKISFSKMTFTHEMIRVFLKEQVYRAFAILAGKTYHK